MKPQPLLQEILLKKLNFTLACLIAIYSFKLVFTSALQAAPQTPSAKLQVDWNSFQTGEKIRRQIFQQDFYSERRPHPAPRSHAARRLVASGRSNRPACLKFRTPWPLLATTSRTRTDSGMIPPPKQ